MERPEVLYHIQMKPGDVGRYVFLPGDPGRTDKIARYFDNPRLVANNREYKTYTGTLAGEKVSVTSTGIGCPSAAIAVEELAMIGADTFIRVGTSGGMQPYLKPGELAIITAAIRDEGTSKQYMPVEFPAVANVEVVTALREAAERLGNPYHLGITHSKDSFYGQHQPERMPVKNYLRDRWTAWKDGGAICSEMEAAAIFIISSILGKRAGGIMLIAANQESEEPMEPVHDLTGLIETSIEAVKILIARDKDRQR
ncbi:MAG: uridine phosphorylase [Ardenticatenaceae bacterium]|nr:uridine phosphorylase [Ardenticatenaceae bacterium]